MELISREKLKTLHYLKSPSSDWAFQPMFASIGSIIVQFAASGGPSTGPARGEAGATYFLRE